MPAYTRESALSRDACEKLLNEREIPSKGLPLVKVKSASSLPRTPASTTAAAPLKALCVEG